MEIVLILVCYLGLLIHIVCGVTDKDGLQNAAYNHSNAPSLHHIQAVLTKDGSKERIQQPDCSNPESLVCIDVKRKISGYKATLHSCPTVEKVHLQLPDRGHFKKARHANPNVKTRGDRKGLTIYRPRRRQDVWFSSARGTATFEQDTPALEWEYKAPNNWNNGTMWRQGTECLRRSNSRNKRASKDNVYFVEQTDLKECGHKISCIRFGTKDCGHLECEYLLTYKIVNHSVLHLEISGRSHGWIALGLSSDDKMGGDDVIVCKKRIVQTDELVAASMYTKVAHAKPQPHSVNELNLRDTKISEGYIYCKMTRYLKDRASSSKVDLTNNWFQFYARGEIDRNGGILKHTEIPPTSLETITMLRHTNIYSHAYQKLSPKPGHSPPTFSHHSIEIALLYSLTVILFKVIY